MTRRSGSGQGGQDEPRGVVLRKRRDEVPDRLVRTFCALTLDRSIVDTVSTALAPVRSSLERANWVDPSRWHVTVKFFGEIPESGLSVLGNVLQAAAGDRLPIQLRGVGAFPDLREPQVIWVGVRDQGDGLKLLHRRLNDACYTLGYEADNRKFRPHITVARIRQSKAYPIARELTPVLDTLFADFEASVLTLFRSDLGPDGAEYTVLRTIALATPTRRRSLTPEE
jgi:2'-5' RNA ligase